ncbi:CRISPR-associated helicase Cas3' [Lacticaseibacillus absianus]|uniref:CRISPR-associated helicase Cas3' n=1 Tax=Lacticaseibacillus absianus TaxID=2729623 RepID=UPI0015CC1761|nr:CRISPR-associated helicase Cas3' [Lacticaseibacillus absianus]
MEITALDPATRALWAKKRTVDGQQLWLPLVAHLQDCANAINALYNLWLSDSQKRRMMATMTDDELRRLLKFIALAHDLGKGIAAFQRKPSYGGSQAIDHVLTEQLIRAGFMGLDQARIEDPEQSPHALAGEALLERAGVPVSVAAIIGGHHGRIAEYPPTKNICQFTANYWQSDKDAEQQRPWRRVQEQLIRWALEQAGYTSVNEIPDVDIVQSVLIEGLLIMADWLSSSEFLNDDPTRPLFPLIPIEHHLRDLDLTARFRRAWSTWHVDEPWRPAPVQLTPDPYQARWQFAARPVQRAITQAIDATTEPGLVLIEAPMGLGKTESALVAAEQLASKTGSSGLFFGLPTQATSNAMFRRVSAWLDVQATQQGGHLSLELLHGRAKFNEAFRALPHAQAVAQDDDEPAAVVVNEWFSGKKSILDTVSVGTIDNLLQMALKQKHLSLRHLGFSGKVVCIDEVHAVDTYMLTYLDGALEWLGAYHVPVVILSATLPIARRNELLGAYYHGRFNAKLRLSDAQQACEAYPLVTLLDGQQVHQITDFPGPSDQADLTIQVERHDDDPEGLVDRVCRAIAAGGVAGVIVNTVQRAQTLAQLVPPEIPTLILHSSFLAPDRTKLEDQLETLIGKAGVKRPDRLIVIGTQVLEQSLDIDFDILFTDIAPMDLLLQRAGRLHRHQRQRPAALKAPKMVVMGILAPGDYGEANAAIYTPYLLMRTDAALPSEIRLPDDISPLVQRVYAFTDEPAFPGLEAAKAAFETLIEQKEARATTFRLAPPKKLKRATLHKWQAGGTLPGVDQSDQRGVAAVRDIDESLEVIVIKQTRTGAQLIDGRPLAQCAEATIAAQIMRLPQRFSQRWNIEATIRTLEDQTAAHLPQWRSSSWLRGALALILDEQAEAELDGYRLHYSPHLGLMYTKEEGNHG